LFFFKNKTVLDAMKNLLYLLLTGLVNISAWSQTDRIDSLLADLLDDYQDKPIMPASIPEFHYLYTGAMYNNRTFYAGREIGENMYNLSGNIYYFNSSGFYLGASGTWLSQLDPRYYSTIATAGILKSTGNKTRFIYRAAYSRYFYYQSDPSTDYSFKNNLGTGLTIRNKWIGGKVTLNLMFDEGIGVNVSSTLFSSFTIFQINKISKVAFEPEAYLFLGSETIGYEPDINSQLIDSQTSTNTMDEVFGLLNIQLYVPVRLSLNNFELELGIAVNKPLTQEQNISYPLNTCISVSFGYLLPLN
jgi:hypothetical protein